MVEGRQTEKKDEGQIRKGTVLLLLGLTLSSPTVSVRVQQSDKTMTHAYPHTDSKGTKVTFKTSAAEISSQCPDHLYAH